MSTIPVVSVSQNIAPPTAAREVLYLASPVATYGTPRYDLMISHAQCAFPEAELLPALGLYSDSADWLATWPAHLARISALAYFADTDGSIGKGVYKEIADAQARGIPVYYLSDNGALIPGERVALELIDGGLSWRRYAHVRLVGVVEASTAGEPEGVPK